MESIWSKYTKIPPREALSGDISADVAIIGGGMAGILCGYMLKKQGVEAVILEADRIGSGQTKNTTAKITSEHGMIYDRLIRKFGLEYAKKYAFANENAISEYKKIIEEEQIGCHFKALPSYIYSREEDEGILREFRAASRIGLPAKLTKDTSLPFPVAAALKFEGQAQFSPLEFLAGISRKLCIFEQTKVEKIKGHTLITEKGNVRAKKIIVATHYPFVNFPGLYFLRLHQERSYVIALQNASVLDGMYLGVGADQLSFRNIGELLLLGGASHRTGENKEGGKYAGLRRFAKEYYPECREMAHWSAEDCVSSDEIPFIGQYSGFEDDIYVATGFRKWGMTSSMVAAMILSGKIAGNEPDFADVFSPRRFNITASAKNFLTDTSKSVKGLTKSAFFLPSRIIGELPCSKGGIVRYRSHKVGVYKDGGGNAYIVSVKCPHLGCQLEWNPDELSWDCPCHGSRFDYKGKLIDAPAQTSLRSQYVPAPKSTKIR